MRRSRWKSIFDIDRSRPVKVQASTITLLIPTLSSLVVLSVLITVQSIRNAKIACNKSNAGLVFSTSCAIKSERSQRNSLYLVLINKFMHAIRARVRSRLILPNASGLSFSTPVSLIPVYVRYNALTISACRIFLYRSRRRPSGSRFRLISFSQR